MTKAARKEDSLKKEEQSAKEETRRSDGINRDHEGSFRRGQQDAEEHGHEEPRR